jgi:beta-N-acetylhexosaminidase
VADLYYAEANDIIGDRSFGETPEQVASLALAAAEALMDSKIIPIIKHIPGHGRALVDSHLELPIVTTDLQSLEKTDFHVFKKLNHLPMAMTAHIIFTALDSSLPVTISAKSIEYIRKKIGFNGLIIGDDLNMKALKGSLGELAKQTLKSGCDIALHCSGVFEEMEEVLNAIE